MRFRLLLFSLLVMAGFTVCAQSTAPNYSLIISEARMDAVNSPYLEFTNMGDTDIDLSEYETGMCDPWTNPWTMGGSSARIRLSGILKPGESFTVGLVKDLVLWRSKINYDKYGLSGALHETFYIYDMEIHNNDGGEAAGQGDHDSITTSSVYQYSANIFGNDWWGSCAHYLRHFYTNADGVLDSTVVDAVNVDFKNSSNQRSVGQTGLPVAGVENATRTSLLVRRFNVKRGAEGWDSLDTAHENWDKAAGISIEDSEWIPIPLSDGDGQNYGRKMYWTVGNHANATIDQLKSNLVDVDLAAQTMAVDWSVRAYDSIINAFDKIPGIAWVYKKQTADSTLKADSPAVAAVISADSAFTSVQTGDTLTIYACGNTLEKKSFVLTRKAASASENRVIPKHDYNGNFTGFSSGIRYTVTEDVPTMDSIKMVPFATRVDTLFKYLEKPAAAKWEIVWVDGVERPELKLGDILKVTSENGAVKEYFIKTRNYVASDNAYLSAITWPDVPEDYRDVIAYGMKGDTLSAFARGTKSYKFLIPSDVEGIPGLVALTENLNTKVSVKRATTLTGTPAERTIVFSTTSPSDTIKYDYSVTFSKEIDPDLIQPFYAEPFISQFTFRSLWNTSYWEFVNPSNQTMDMSNYMFARGWSANPADNLGANLAAENWSDRYFKYVPGYKWQDQASWEVQPGILEQDVLINPILQPGDVFVIARISGTSQKPRHVKEVDVDFGNNPWGEDLNVENVCAYGWLTDCYTLFKIKNDSIQAGTKPVGNIDDFEVLDYWANADGASWVVGGLSTDQCTGWTRKPEIWHGNPVAGASFGTTEDDSEWTMLDRTRLDALGFGWDEDVCAMSDGMGSHIMNEVTLYKSTVGSAAYIVSDGYLPEHDLMILGVKAGTTVDEFLAAIIKADEGQTLTVMQDGSAITGATAIPEGATLVVVSADEQNTSTYAIDVTEAGLDNNALLTSDVYTIAVDGAKGTISGFDYGTELATVYSNVVVPETASNFFSYNNKGEYAAFKGTTYDTTSVNTIATDQNYFEVVAQDGKTSIVYQLIPTADESAAYVTSIRYAVDQEASVISFVPGGTSAATFISHLTPAAGASLKLVDKMGFERTAGNIYQDDKLIVTAADGKTTKIYYISMLVTNGATTSYLAYVYSEKYAVDQQALTIEGTEISNEVSVADFSANILASFGATFVIEDAEGNVKTSGNMAKGDKLVVTSSNTYYSNAYTIDVAVVSAKAFEAANVSMYPNPTTGFVTLKGVNAGSSVKVVNVLGATVLDFVTLSDNETINIENQKAGIYMVVVSSDNKLVGNFKLIKK